jgi:hypothetical protein
VGGRTLTPSQRRTLAELEGQLARQLRYDDESVVAQKWIRQRYDCGCYPSYGPARRAVVRTAWHEAGHAVAALAIGAEFSSASIHHGRNSEGRVHQIRFAGGSGSSGGRGSPQDSGVSPQGNGASDQAFVIDAAGQIAERLATWTMLDDDGELARWLVSWRDDGGDARHFRRSMKARFGTDEVGAWRYAETTLIAFRPKIHRLARALLMHPRHLPYAVAAALAGIDQPDSP